MKRVLLGAVFAVVLLGSSQPGEAAVSCSTDLLDCYQSAAAVDSFWYRWAAGLDCELSFVECARIALMG
jgi:hypothetical protein